jgi:hypothetical protein
LPELNPKGKMKMSHLAKWTMVSLVALFLFMSQAGMACARKFGGKTTNVNGVPACDCTGGGTTCACIVDDGTGPCGGGVAPLQE